MSAAADSEGGGCYALVAGVVWQPLGDGVMLLDVAKGEYFELNPSGARMFELVLSYPSLALVEQQLLGEFEAPIEQIRPDLQALLKTLQEAELIRPAPPAVSRP